VDLVIVDAVGAPRAMGRSHGEHARDLIHQARSGWCDAMSATGKEPASMVEALSKQSGFRAATERHVSWALEEVAGIAEGSGLSPDEVFALNCLDEAWWWGSPAPGCSTVAIGSVDDHPAVCGQTMDLDDWMNGTQIALRTAASNAPGAVMLSRAGMLGLCGANDAGVAILVNTLADLPVATSGVPVAFVLRAALAARSINEAATTLQRLPHASGQAYTLISAEGVIGMECAAGVAVEYINDPFDPCRIWHTNHALSAAPRSAPEADSIERMEALETRIDRLRVVNDVKDLLADGDSGICMYAGRWPGPWETFGAVTAELGTASVVSIAPGPPDRTPWHDVAFIS